MQLDGPRALGQKRVTALAQELKDLKTVPRVVLLGGVTFLCLGGLFAWLVLASGHKSTLRDPGSVSSPRDGDEYLARAADCVACHSIPGGKGFAGGLKMGTPLGAIYSTNITPDPETGIGRYSLADFDLAVRYGIAKDGHHLYPAMLIRPTSNLPTRTSWRSTAFS